LSFPAKYGWVGQWFPKAYIFLSGFFASVILSLENPSRDGKRKSCLRRNTHFFSILGI
jgi:hypothetical protein